MHDGSVDYHFALLPASFCPVRIGLCGQFAEKILFLLRLSVFLFHIYNVFGYGSLCRIADKGTKILQKILLFPERVVFLQSLSGLTYSKYTY